MGVKQLVVVAHTVVALQHRVDGHVVVLVMTWAVNTATCRGLADA